MAFPQLRSRSLSSLLPLALLAGPALSQGGSGGAEGPAMVATPRYLFVLRDGVVYQLDVDTLELRNRADLDALGGLPERAARERAERPAGPPNRVLPADATRRAVARALEWLEAHQDPDGRWDADGFMKHDGDGARSDGAGNPIQDVGVTGLALLAFLGDGSTLRSGEYRDVVERGVSWLRDQQAANGLIGRDAGHDFIYGHAIATLALCEAYGLSDHAPLRSSAQSAIDYLESHRNPYMVWRYQPRSNDNDTSVTMWCLMAYRSASDFGLDVNGQAMKLVEMWLDQVTDPATGRAGYTKRGEPSSRHAGDHARRFPPERNEALTAAALLGRFLLGQRPETTPVMQAAADTILEKPPRWDEDAGTIDGYYWYFGTGAMYQMGGRHWREWAAHVQAAILATQREDGSFAGSWDPKSVWSEDGGRVYTTALMALALESCERVERLRKR